MSNLVKLPLQDSFRTSLSQQWTGWVGTVNVASTPSFTFPSWVTTYLVVNPWKTTMQIAEVSAYDWTAKTFTVSNVTLEKWAGFNSTAQTHAVGSEVIISDNYQFWKDIQTAINTKMNLDVDNVITAGKTSFTSTTESQFNLQNVTTTQRDALTWVVNWDICYNTTDWVLNQYISWAWTTFASGAVVNASTTVSGKVEIATDAELWAGTSTGWTWALLWLTVDNSSTTQVTNKVPVLNGAWQITPFINSQADGASSTTEIWLVELSTDAEALAWTDTTRYINPKQLQAKTAPYIWTGTTPTWWTSPVSVTITHSLWKIPSLIRLNTSYDNAYIGWMSNWIYNFTNYWTTWVSWVNVSTGRTKKTFSSSAIALLEVYNTWSSAFNTFMSVSIANATTTQLDLVINASWWSNTTLDFAFSYVIEVYP